MRILGAILAGGQSRRFGSNKALALFRGKTLIAHAIDTLRSQVDLIVTCGMTVADVTHLADRPAPDMGPLGGIAAALHYAATHNFDAVFSTGCDMPSLPDRLVETLAAHGDASFVRNYPMIGLWPVALSERLDAHLATSPDRSMRAWTRLIDAHAIDLPPLANINTPEDLAALERGRPL